RRDHLSPAASGAHSPLPAMAKSLAGRTASDSYTIRFSMNPCRTASTICSRSWTVATMGEGPFDASGDEAFKRELLQVLPHLRAFARGLSGRPDFADDLVQETAIKAWSARERFTAGTSMRAWTFAIL